MFESLFIGTAHAMAQQQGGTGAAQQASWYSTLVPLVVIFAIFYLLMIRPQQKQQKKHREMLAAIKKGDKVITRGGMQGTVYGITDAVITIEVAENVRLKFTRDAIAAVVTPQSSEQSA
jgi:preprotein translocase subunit YajC